MRKKRAYLFVALAFIIGVGYMALHRWSVEHVTYLTGGVPHPIGCVSCHVYPQRDGFIANLVNEDYISPINATVSADGSRLYVIGQESDLLIEVDTKNREVLSSTKVGYRPHSVVLTKDQKTAIVSNQWANNIYFIDLSTKAVTDSTAVGGGPAGLSLSNDGTLLYVANTYTNNVSVVDIAQKQELKRLHAGNFPTNVAASPKDDYVFVSSQRTVPIEFRTEPQTELTVLNASNQRVNERKYFNSAHIMENVAVTPSGDMAITTLVRPKNNVPSVQIESGWMINHGIGVIMEDGRVAQLLLDEPNSFFADPYDIVIHPNGKYAYVSHSGVDVVSVIDLDEIRTLLADATEDNLKVFANHLGLSSRYVMGRIKTGANPKGLAISPDGNYVYVVERMEDRISVIDTKQIMITGTVDLGGPGRVTYTREGGKLFNNAGHTFHNQYSCYTCHPDGHEDGLTYDLTGTGGDLANVQTLRDLYGTAPFKWIGTNQSVYKQCGMRFSMFVTRTESFNPEELDAVVAYIMRELTHPPNLNRLPNGELTEAQKRGRDIFYRTMTTDGREIPVEDRCSTCHSGPNYSNYEMADVGTLKEYDSPTLFDSPNLNNIYESAPYLHDGSAGTLEEIWTKFNDNDEHGYANDMTKDQLNDLVEYLKSLSAERYYTKEDTEYEINKSQL
jgi:YVTN family beta-propeller protein